MTDFDNSIFDKGKDLFPQPVAFSCGRICRARHPQERLEAILKAAEVLTRYVAALAVSSFCARADQEVAAPKGMEDFKGSLSFGHYLSLVQLIAAQGCEHPLRDALAGAFAGVTAGPKGEAAADAGAFAGGEAKANASLIKLLNLRNHLGHALGALDEAKALKTFREDEPDRLLSETLVALEELMGMPLFLLEQQTVVKKQLTARRLLLMGESSDPDPEEIALGDSLMHDHGLYVGTKAGALNLYPFLIWDLSEAKANYSIYLIHHIEKKQLKYVTVDDSARERNSRLVESLARRLKGDIVAAEDATLADGSTFLAEWSKRRRELERIRQENSGEIPWDDLDKNTLRWYARHLGAGASDAEIREAITERLLDGRELLNPKEVRQIVLLFGEERLVARTLRRAMIDCKAIVSPDVRWDERVESSKNVLESLKLAIEFFGRHVGIGGVTIDGLSATSGTADYIAMRESLVNLFIHQDYTDTSAAGQIEITKDRATFFNTGKSLVSPTNLVEGGKSQSRNPLISRALRLIGFAELAGSGLREVRRAWRQERRQPPDFVTNPSANTFTLTLDWRTLPDITDEFWKQRLGLKLTPQEAYALLLSAETDGTSAEEIAAAQGLYLDEGQNICQRLVKEALVSKKGDRIHIKDHLKQLVEEAKTKPASE